MRTHAIVLAVLVAAGALSPAAYAGPAAAPVRAEIDALLARLVASGCAFERNGATHDGPAARDHLLRKLDYLENHGTVKSTEQFVDEAATASSLSGQPYLVVCAGAVPQESRPWLLKQLAQLRATPRPAAASAPASR
jgi:hypothetical protein